jgi:hypothetical protein
VKTADFWTPSTDDVIVAERTFREWIKSGAKEASAVFPEMADHPENFPPDEVEFERRELDWVDQNYEGYARQFVGIIVDGQKFIVCNYSIVPGADPAAGYLFLQKTFAGGRGMHFVEAWYDPDAKSCSRLAMVGLWQEGKGKF